VSSGVDAGYCPRREGRTGGRCELGQVEVPHLAETERLGDRERPIPKLRFGRQHLDADATFPQLPQGQHGLESRDAPTRNQNLHPTVASFHCIFLGRRFPLVYLSVLR
jgi:hypothetical protein